MGRQAARAVATRAAVAADLVGGRGRSWVGRAGLVGRAHDYARPIHRRTLPGSVPVPTVYPAVPGRVDIYLLRGSGGYDADARDGHVRVARGRRFHVHRLVVGMGSQWPSLARR